MLPVVTDDDLEALELLRCDRKVFPPGPERESASSGSRGAVSSRQEAWRER